MNTTTATLLLLAFLLGIGVSSAIGSVRLSRKAEKYNSLPGSGIITKEPKGTFPSIEWTVNFLQGLSTEMFGAILTTIFLGLLLSLVQQNEVIMQRRNELILQMGSPDNGIAVEAVRQLRNLKLLDLKSLENIDLSNANLASANLSGLRFTNVNLSDANLSGADLYQAELINVNLSRTNLDNTILNKALLQNVDAHLANFHQAYLFETQLNMVHFEDANLEGAFFSLEDIIKTEDIAFLFLESRDDLTAQLMPFVPLQRLYVRYPHVFDLPNDTSGAYFFDAKLIGCYLPDGMGFLGAISELERFTHRDNEGFWRSKVPWSPAYEVP